MNESMECPFCKGLHTFEEVKKDLGLYFCPTTHRRLIIMDTGTLWPHYTERTEHNADNT